MTFNQLHPPFNNPAIRRALLGAIVHSVSLARAEELCESFGDYLAGVGELAEEQPSTG